MVFEARDELARFCPLWWFYRCMQNSRVTVKNGGTRKIPTQGTAGSTIPLHSCLLIKLKLLVCVL